MHGDGAVRARRPGTTTATLTAAGKKHAAATDVLTGTGALGESSGQIFWAAGSQGTLWAANLDGTSAQPIVLRQADPQGVAADGSHIYWVANGTNGTNGSIWEANLDGSDATPVVIHQANPWGVAVGASHIYWTDTTTGTVNEANLDGTSPQAIVTGQSHPFGVAVSADHLYWSSAVPASPRPDHRRPTWTAPARTSSSSARTSPRGWRSSTSHLYWIGTGDDTVNEANLDGSSPQTIASPGPGQVPIGVAAGVGHLYWTTNTDGSIWRPTSTAPARRPSSPARPTRREWRSPPALANGQRRCERPSQMRGMSDSIFLTADDAVLVSGGAGRRPGPGRAWPRRTAPMSEFPSRVRGSTPG